MLKKRLKNAPPVLMDGFFKKIEHEKKDDLSNKIFFNAIIKNELTEFEVMLSGDKLPLEGEAVPIGGHLLLNQYDLKLCQIFEIIQEKGLIVALKDDCYEYYPYETINGEIISKSEQLYLFTILGLITQIYEIDFCNDATAVVSCMEYPLGDSSHEIVGKLGYLIAEYFWKFSHETAAVQGHKVRSTLESARAESRKEKQKQSKYKNELYLDLAYRIMNDNPKIRYGNVSKLAEAIHQHEDCPRTKIDEEPSDKNRKLTKKAIANSLYSLKKQGKLTFSD